MLPDPLCFERICRICLSTSEKLVHLFKSGEDFVSTLVSLTTLLIADGDELPQNICQFCSHQIQTAHFFILKCQESDRKLRLSLQNKLDKSGDSTSIINTEISSPQRVDEDVPDTKAEEKPTGPQKRKTKRRRLKIVKDAVEENIPEIVDTKYTCTHCRTEYTSLDLLVEHVKIHDQNDKEEPTDCTSSMETEPIKCGVCNKTFASKKNRDRHKLRHMNEEEKQNLFKCPICGKQMKHSNHFKIHMRTHGDFESDTPAKSSEKKKEFICTICGKACTSRSNLAVHTRRHTGNMTNFCNVCGKGYPRSTDLTIHMRKHTGERPFVCSICNRGFARSDKLTIHIRTHTGEKPYSCNNCSRSFAQRNDLISHQRRNVCGNASKKANNDNILQDGS